MTRLVFALQGVLVLAGVACGGGSTPGDAAVDSASPTDAGSVVDGAMSLAWVDFAITGCTLVDQPSVPGPDAGPGDGDAGAPVDAGVVTPQICVGAAPLAIRFTPLSPTPVDTFRWDFGDGQESVAADPVHVFAEPGRYTVSLIAGGPGGTAQVEKVDLLEVQPAPFGAPCAVSAQCESSLACLCGDGESCPAGLSGRCLAECGPGAPCADGACIDLAASTPAMPEAWQRATCLPTCESDGECAAGSTCQELPMTDGSWTRACFAPGILGAMGDACLDASGQPVPSACASGECAPLGARGMCSAACVAGSCPPSSACAQFATGGPDRCVRRCDDPAACSDDPWLACELPGGAGMFGFQVDEVVMDASYCAPRACTEAAECGTDGSCESGFCGP